MGCVVHKPVDLAALYAKLIAKVLEASRNTGANTFAIRKEAERISNMLVLLVAMVCDLLIYVRLEEIQHLRSVPLSDVFRKNLLRVGEQLGVAVNYLLILAACCSDSALAHTHTYIIPETHQISG